MSLDRIADLSDGERAALRELGRAVYPPAEWADWPGHQIEWAAAEWCVRIWGEDGRLASYVGVGVRDAEHDGRPVRIGGVGGVKTHPDHRRRGHAGRGIRRAVEFFAAQPNIDFALLFCEPRLIDYYASLGWQEFAGRLLVRQRSAAEDFTFCRVMTHAVRLPGPTAGVIDLLGPPW
jgi:hypothetical protein